MPRAPVQDVCDLPPAVLRRVFLCAGFAPGGKVARLAMGIDASGVSSGAADAVAQGDGLLPEKQTFLDHDENGDKPSARTGAALGGAALGHFGVAEGTSFGPLLSKLKGMGKREEFYKATKLAIDTSWQEGFDLKEETAVKGRKQSRRGQNRFWSYGGKSKMFDVDLQHISAAFSKADLPQEIKEQLLRIWNVSRPRCKRRFSPRSPHSPRACCCCRPRIRSSAQTR